MPPCNVLLLCECLSKINRTIEKDGKTELKSTNLSECNTKYGIHFFSKHKDLLTAALEKKDKYDDQMILPMYKYHTVFQKLSTKEENIESTHVCFACRRLFNDTEIDEGKRNGTSRNAYSCKGKIRIHSAEKKWEMHEDKGHCTRESRLRALHTFMVFESGSDLLRSRVTDAQKIGLVEPVEKRGRKIKDKTLVPKVIETIKIIELPAAPAPPPMPTLTIVDESAEIKKLKEEMKKLQIQLRLCEIANAGYQTYKDAIENDWKDSDTALKREKQERERKYKTAVEEGAFEDTEDNRDDLEGY